MIKRALVLLLIASVARADAWLTVGPNHNLLMGNGGTVSLDITQHLYGPLSLLPHGSLDTNVGFRDRSMGADLQYEFTPRLNATVGSTYDKYELLGASPTEDTDVHAALHVKLW